MSLRAPGRGLEGACQKGGTLQTKAPEGLCSWILAPLGQAGALGLGPARSHRLAPSPSEWLSSPLKMGCDLFQSLSFGFRDTEQGEKDTEDAESGGKPEGSVGPEDLLQRDERPWVDVGRDQEAPQNH